MKLTEIFKEAFEAKGNAEQFWIKPDGNFLIPCKHYHYVTVMMNPGEFGVPAEVFEKWKAKAHGFASDPNQGDLDVYQYCVDTSVSDEVMTYIYKQGWMRFDLYRMSDYLSITTWKLDAARRKGVTNFVKNVYNGSMARWISLRATGDTEVGIYQNYRDVDTVTYTAKDILKGYLEEE